MLNSFVSLNYIHLKILVFEKCTSYTIGAIWKELRNFKFKKLLNDIFGSVFLSRKVFTKKIK